MINAFVQLLLTMGQVQSDVVGDLPTEMGAKILRYLDPESLVSAARVNRRWKSICKGDAVLRRRIRKQLQKEKRARVQAYNNASAGVEVTRRNPAVMFGARNGTVAVKVKPVKYEVPAGTAVPQMKKFKVKKINNKVQPMGVAAKKKSDVHNNVKMNCIKMMRI